MLRQTLAIALLGLFIAACGESSTSQPTLDAGGTDEDMSMPDVACVAMCDDLECGVDPVCGESCGTCGDGETCESGVCECVPECDDRACGSDGCGGSCGTCEQGEMCNDMTGVCATTCTPATCEDLASECGTYDDGCGATTECGECTVGGCDEGICVNTPPSFSFTNPGDEIVYSVDTVELAWTDEDLEDDAQISLFWDDDATGADGTLIQDGISEDDPTDTYTWDISQLNKGVYWVYATIDDGSGPVTVYAENPIAKPVKCEPLGPSGLTFDIQTVDLTIDLTLDGAPVTASNTGGALGRGFVYLRNVLDGSVTGVVDTDQALPPSTVVVQPGVYDVLYYGEGTNWPNADVALLQKNVPISASGNLNIDVPVEDLTFDITVDGQSLAGFTWPKIELRSRGDLGLVTIQDPGSLPITLPVIPGSYDVIFDRVQPSIPQPLGALDMVPRRVGEIQSGQTNTLDIPTVLQEINVSHNGTPVDSSNSSNLDQAFIGLISTDGSGYGAAKRTWDSQAQTAVNPVVVRVPEGRYDVLYWRGSGSWPSMSKIYQEDIEAGVSPVSMNVESAPITINLSMNGTPVTGTELDDANLLIPQPGRRDASYTIYNGSITDEFHLGTYEAKYASFFATMAGFPPGGFTSLGTFDTNTQTQTFDFQTHTVTLTPTFSGSSTGSVELYLRAFDFYTAYDRILYVFPGNPSVTLELAASTYELGVASRFGDVLPGEPATLRTLDVNADLNEMIDISVKQFQIDMTLNGQPLTEQDLAGLDFGIQGYYAQGTAGSLEVAFGERLRAFSNGPLTIPTDVHVLEDRSQSEPIVVAFINRDLTGQSNLPLAYPVNVDADGVFSYSEGSIVACIEPSAP